jgi:hypothetical protein
LEKNANLNKDGAIYVILEIDGTSVALLAKGASECNSNAPPW